MDRIEHLQKVIDATTATIPPPAGQGLSLSALRKHHQVKGFYAFYANGDLAQAKQEFYQYGQIFVFDVTVCKSKLLYWATYNTAYVLLSDAAELIETYGTLSSAYQEEQVTKGQPAIYTRIMQDFMVHDLGAVAQHLRTLEEKVITRKSRKSAIPNYVFFKALLERDKDQVSESLHRFSSKRIQSIKMRNDALFKRFTAFPALGFTKLAWQQGLEVEVDSPFIPMELMPVKPNAEYVNAYPNLESYTLLL